MSSWWQSIFKDIRGILARAYVRVVGVNREPSWLLFEIFFPLFPICTFAFTYKAVNASNDYLGFVILGGAMSAIWMNVLWGMAAQFFWERESGNLTIYMLCPMNIMSVLLGMALGSSISTFFRVILTFLIGKFLFDVKLTVHSWFWLFLTFIVTILALFSLGMMMASFFLVYSRSAWNVLTIFIEPIYFISGFYFPVKMFGNVVATIVSIIPVTLGLDALRQLAFKLGMENAFLPYKVEVLILFCLAIIYFILAKYLLAKFERISRYEGRLTLRWQ